MCSHARRCCQSIGGIYASREELPDDWADEFEDKNSIPLSGIETTSYTVPDLRSPDHDLWMTRPPPYNRNIIGTWACLCGIFPCFGHCVDSTPEKPCCKCCCNNFCRRNICCWCKDSSCCCCTSKCVSGVCCPCLSGQPCAKRNDLAATTAKAGTTSLWRGFLQAPAVYDLVFEANRSQFLSIWNLAMFFLTLTLLLSPLSFGDLHNVSCQAAFGFTPSYRSFFNPNKLNNPTFLGSRPKVYPWLSQTHGDVVGSKFEMDRARPQQDWATVSSQQNLAEAAEACAAACNSDDVDVVANAYFMSSSDIFSINHKNVLLQYSYDTITTKEKFASCGYFRSQYSSPSTNSVTEAWYSNSNLYIRPLLLAAVNTRMNRFWGWAGVFWIAAVSLDMSILIDRSMSDIQFCPSMFNFKPSPRGWYDLPTGMNDGTSSWIGNLDSTTNNGTDPLDKFKHYNATHFTCNISASMVRQLKGKLLLKTNNGHGDPSTINTIDGPSQTYCKPVNYNKDIFEQAGLDTSESNGQCRLWRPPSMQIESTENGYIFDQSRLSCSTQLPVKSEKGDGGLIGKIFANVGNVLRGKKKKDSSIPWDQEPCSELYDTAPCLNGVPSPSYTAQNLIDIVNRYVKNPNDEEFINDPQFEVNTDYCPNTWTAFKECAKNNDCRLNETSGKIEGLPSDDDGRMDYFCHFPMEMGQFKFFQGSTTLPRLSSCARDRSYWYLKTEKAEKELAKRLIAFAAEKNTTVKILKEENDLVVQQNERLKRDGQAWVNTKNDAVCTNVNSYERIPVPPIPECGTTAATQEYNWIKYKVPDCLYDDLDWYKDYNKLKDIDYNNNKRTDKSGPCDIKCPTCTLQHYYNATKRFPKSSSYARFVNIEWPNEVTDNYERKYKEEEEKDTGIVLEIPMTFYDTDRWLQDKISPKFIFDWMTLRVPMNYMLDDKTIPGKIIGVLVLLTERLAGLTPTKWEDGKKVKDYSKEGPIITSWKKATSSKPTPLNVATASELLEKNFKNRQNFSRKIGMTWTFLQWVRYLGLFVELFALFYLAVKVFTRRFAAKEGSPCHSIYLFLNRSASERVDKMKSKAHETSVKGRKLIRKRSEASNAEDNDEEEGSGEDSRKKFHRLSTTSVSAYREKKKKSRQRYQIPSRVWAAVGISLAMTLLSTAMCLNFWTYIYYASVSGTEALEGVATGLNNPAGTLTKFLKKTAPKVRDRIFEALPDDPFNTLELSHEFKGLAHDATSDVFNGATNFVDGQSVTLNFTYNGIAMPNVTLSAGSVRLLQTGILECVTNATSGSSLNTFVRSSILNVSDDALNYVEEAMKKRLTGEKSKGISEDIVVLYEQIADNIEGKVHDYTGVFTDPDVCVPLMRDRMSGVVACLDQVASDTADTLPSPAVEELAKKNITYTQYKEQAREVLATKYRLYSQKQLPEAMCDASADMIEGAVQQSWKEMLSANNLINNTVAYALDSPAMRAGFENIPGIPGGDIYTYLQSLGDDDKEMLMGLGSKYANGLMNYISDSSSGQKLQDVMAKCYPNVTIAGDSYEESAQALYNSQVEAADLDRADCKKLLYNAIDITQSPKYQVVQVILVVLLVVGIVGAVFACFCFFIVAYQIYTFLVRLKALGDKQAKTITLYYDAKTGYKKALGLGSMTISDICAIGGRMPTKAEIDFAGGLKDEERKLPTNIRWFAKKLAYRHLM